MSHNGQTIDACVMLNLDRCIECGSCAAACYYSHGAMPSVNFARSGPALLPVICRQCKNPACVDACPAEAMVRNEHGVVERLLALCIGCGSCARACPFGVLPNEPSGTPAGYQSADRLNGHQIAKCDLCGDRVTGGDGAEPRCVAACPTGALIFDDPACAAERGLHPLGGRVAGEDPFKRR
jgi:Fe-S-cluster-containing dehydrogenase component